MLVEAREKHMQEAPPPPRTIAIMETLCQGTNSAYHDAILEQGLPSQAEMAMQVKSMQCQGFQQELVTFLKGFGKTTLDPSRHEAVLLRQFLDLYKHLTQGLLGVSAKDTNKHHKKTPSPDKRQARQWPDSKGKDEKSHSPNKLRKLQEWLDNSCNSEFVDAYDSCCSTLNFRPSAEACQRYCRLVAWDETTPRNEGPLPSASHSVVPLQTSFSPVYSGSDRQLTISVNSFQNTHPSQIVEQSAGVCSVQQGRSSANASKDLQHGV